MDEIWMERAISEAWKGRGYVSPNPLVGAVITHNNLYQASGYHQNYGGPHAEILALQSIPKNLKDTTLYVTLEPCFHTGKTPPCVDAILASGISHIVIGCIDPNPLTSGQSIQKLQNAGCRVDVHILEEQARQLILPFLTYHQKHRPHFVMKVVESADHNVAASDRSPRMISGERELTHAHILRAIYDAILIGHQTLITDNPRLDVRYTSGRNPKVIILTRHFDANFLEYNCVRERKHQVFVMSTADILEQYEARFGIQGILFDHSDHPELCIELYSRDMKRHQIYSVLLEGGPRIWQLFWNLGVVDEVYYYRSESKIPQGLPSQIPWQSVFDHMPQGSIHILGNYA